MTTTPLPAGLFHRAHGTGVSYWGPGDLYTWLVTGEESGGAYFAMLATVPPQGGPPTFRLEEVRARYAEAAPRYGMEFFLDA